MVRIDANMNPQGMERNAEHGLFANWQVVTRSIEHEIPGYDVYGPPQVRHVLPEMVELLTQQVTQCLLDEGIGEKCVVVVCGGEPPQ